MSHFAPFIEVRIVKSVDKSRENTNFVLGEIVKWYKRKVCRVNLLRNGKDPHVRIEYNLQDEKKFWGNVFLTNLWDKIEEGSVDLPDSNLFSSNASEDDLFLILNYTTNKKAYLRRDFNFAINLMKTFGFEISFEEILDGFLLFYHTREDFLMSQIKNRLFSELLKIITHRRISTIKNLQFLKKNYKYLKSQE
ncbi:hypothetical protein NEF87_000275 [Candidatus Lokiarchaeum ossiferum]|uniref:Uncharacterized protein n=1 Tax=Candidatus Lokiarchaeum ossiferum TaxID=2951803 RepID=A0ABY6HKE0_9ARCH|nr:hypothetical protein NEF87_000275 [Candidatus Lokiarchaeum sp. B-35]